MSNSIEHIISACLRNEASAQKELYHLYVDRLYYTVLRYINDTYVVENVLQDVFIKIFTKLDTYDPTKGAFSTWSTTIAIRESLNHLRKRKLIFEPLDKVQVSSNIDSVISSMNVDDLLEIIKRLPTKYQVIFNMHVIDGYSHVEIEKMININQNTSRSYLSRAKKMLQKEIELHLN